MHNLLHNLCITSIEVMQTFVLIYSIWWLIKTEVITDYPRNQQKKSIKQENTKYGGVIAVCMLCCMYKTCKFDVSERDIKRTFSPDAARAEGVPSENLLNRYFGAF